MPPKPPPKKPPKPGSNGAPTPATAATKPIINRVANPWRCCICCLKQNNPTSRAITIIRGYAVCPVHIELAAQPNFDITQLDNPHRAWL